MAHRPVVVHRRAMPASTFPSVLGRRKRETVLTDLPDDILIKIIHHALQMNPRLPGEVSRRVGARFQTVGLVIAQLSQRFLALVRKSVTSLQLTSRPPHAWLNAMLIFANRSLTSLNLCIDDSPCPQANKSINPYATANMPKTRMLPNSASNSNNSNNSSATRRRLRPNSNNPNAVADTDDDADDDDDDDYNDFHNGVAFRKCRSSSSANILMPSPMHVSRFCFMIASTRPPLRVLAVSSLSPAPYEHVVSMLLALPTLREVDLATPRPVDVAAIAHACPKLSALSLGRVSQMREVDEMRRQFTRFVSGRASSSLTTLNIPWCCATTDAFSAIRKYCKSLERLAVELGAMHWIHHRTYTAWKQSNHTFEIDLVDIGREQISILRSIASAVSDGRLRSFALRTLDGIATEDLESLCVGLTGLTELDLFLGAIPHGRLCPPKTFSALERTFAQSLKRVNVVGLRFSAEQVERFAHKFPNLQAISVWIERYERPSVEVFSALGQRIRHLSLLCDWDEHMCAAVGKHNTKLESLFLVTTHLPIESISNLVNGVRFTLNEFRLFFNHRARRTGSGPPFADDIPAQRNDDEPHEQNNNHEPARPQSQPQPRVPIAVNQNEPQPLDEATRKLKVNNTHVLVQEAARLVAKDCSANLEVLNVSAIPHSGHEVIDCAAIAPELRRSAPHLYQICDGYVSD